VIGLNYQVKKDEELIEALFRNEDGLLEIAGEELSIYAPQDKAIRLQISYNLEQEKAEEVEEADRLEGIFYQFLGGEWKEEGPASFYYPHLISDGHFAAKQVWPGEHKASLEGIKLDKVVEIANAYLEKLGVVDLDYQVEAIGLVKRNPFGDRTTD